MAADPQAGYKFAHGCPTTPRCVMLPVTLSTQDVEVIADRVVWVGVAICTPMVPTNCRKWHIHKVGSIFSFETPLEADTFANAVILNTAS